jgi:hypothetical protein
MNEINIIFPYKHHGAWVFDDPEVGLRKEAFVSGADVVIDMLVTGLMIPKAGRGFKLIFSANPFPNYDIRLKWKKKEFSGNTYVVSGAAGMPKMEAWLCPALLRYFKKAPKEIYAKAQPKNPHADIQYTQETPQTHKPAAVASRAHSKRPSFNLVRPESAFNFLGIE